MVLPRLYTPTLFLFLLPNLTLSTWFCTEECKEEIAQGPSCHTESHGTVCLRQSDCTAMSKQHEIFEQVLCQSQYLKEFENKTDCWGIMFEKCHDVAVISTDANRCTGKMSLSSHCKYFFKSQPPFCSVPVRYFVLLLLQRNCPVDTHPDSVLFVQKYHGCSYYCGREILEGPQCFKDISDGVRCLIDCEDPFLQQQGHQLQLFEETACQHGLDEEIDNDPVCWAELFDHCKDLAVPMKNVDLMFCQAQDFLLRSCQRRMNASHPNCNRLTKRFLHQMLVDLQNNQCAPLMASAPTRYLHPLAGFLTVMLLVRHPMTEDQLTL